jgi:hypothetical protein
MPSIDICIEKKHENIVVMKKSLLVKIKLVEKHEVIHDVLFSANAVGASCCYENIHITNSSECL